MFNLLVRNMTKNYDVIIIGAGIFGCAIFHTLSQQRIGKILLVEKNHIASGTTGQSGGLIRKFFHATHLQKFAETSFNYYQNFDAIVGNSCGFRQTGCYYLLPNIDNEIQQQYDYLNNTGYPIEVVNAKSSANLPNIINDANDILLYEPLAGCVDTQLTSKSWISSGLNNKCHLKENTTVVDLIIQNEQIHCIKTNNDIIYANHVILAMGAWSVALLAKQNIHLPLKTKAFQYHRFYQSTNSFSSALLDLRNQFYMVPSSNNEIITGLLNNDVTVDTDALLTEVDLHQTQLLQQSLAIRFPWINKEMNFTNHIAIDAFNENACNIFGEIPNVKGLYHVALGNGGGIKIAPAVAKEITNYFGRSIN